MALLYSELTEWSSDKKRLIIKWRVRAHSYVFSHETTVELDERRDPFGIFNEKQLMMDSRE